LPFTHNSSQQTGYRSSDEARRDVRWLRVNACRAKSGGFGARYSRIPQGSIRITFNVSAETESSVGWVSLLLSPSYAGCIVLGQSAGCSHNVGGGSLA